MRNSKVIFNKVHHFDGTSRPTRQKQNKKLTSFTLTIILTYQTKYIHRMSLSSPTHFRSLLPIIHPQMPQLGVYCKFTLTVFFYKYKMSTDHLLTCAITGLTHPPQQCGQVAQCLKWITCDSSVRWIQVYRKLEYRFSEQSVLIPQR